MTTEDQKLTDGVPTAISFFAWLCLFGLVGYLVLTVLLMAGAQLVR